MIGAAIGAAAGLAGSIFGGISASKARKKANRILDQQEKDNEQWYNRRYNEDYFQSSEAQAALSKAREMANEQYRNAAGAAAVGGATDESVALAKKAGNELAGDVITGLSQQSTARKDAIESTYLDTKQNINNQRISLYNQQAGNASQAASSSLSAGMGLVGSDLQSYLDTGKGLFQNLFSKTRKEVHNGRMV